MKDLLCGCFANQSFPSSSLSSWVVLSTFISGFVNKLTWVTMRNGPGHFVWRQHCWCDHVSQMLTRFDTNIVLGTRRTKHCCCHNVSSCRRGLRLLPYHAILGQDHGKKLSRVIAKAWLTPVWSIFYRNFKINIQSIFGHSNPTILYHFSLGSGFWPGVDRLWPGDNSFKKFIMNLLGSQHIFPGMQLDFGQFWAISDSFQITHGSSLVSGPMG